MPNPVNSLFFRRYSDRRLTLGSYWECPALSIHLESLLSVEEVVTNPGVKDHNRQEAEGEAEVDIKPFVMIIIVVGRPLWATTGRIIRIGGEVVEIAGEVVGIAGEVVEIAGVEAGAGALGREEEGAGEVIEVDQGHPQVATLRGGDLVMAEILTARITESPATGGDQMLGERQVQGLQELRPLLLLTQERQILDLTLETWGLLRRTTPRRLPSSLLAWEAGEDPAEEGCPKWRITISIGRRTAWWSTTAPAKV